jgi:hypothetical protein
VKLRVIILICLVSLLAGCGGSSESLSGFEKRWHSAINSRQPEQLYDMLDAASQRRIREDLERMRGMSEAEQRLAIEQLGGEKVKSLQELSPRKYFARLWERVLEGRKPTMNIEATGGDTAYMQVALDGGRRERIRLMVEGGKWVWVLPEQKFETGARVELPFE